MRPASIDCHHDQRMFVVRHADPGKNRTQRQTRADHGSHAAHGPESQHPSTARYRSLAASDGVTTRKVPAVRQGHEPAPSRWRAVSIRLGKFLPCDRRLHNAYWGSDCFNPTRKVPAVRLPPDGGAGDDNVVSIRLGKFLLCDNYMSEKFKHGQGFNPTRKVPAVRHHRVRTSRRKHKFQSDSESSCCATVPPILGGLSCGFARSFQNLPTGAVDKLIQKIDRLRLCRSQRYRSLPEPPRFVGVSEVLDVDQGLTA